jgi:hypothetical protein
VSCNLNVAATYSDSGDSMGARSVDNATPPMHFLTPHVEISMADAPASFSPAQVLFIYNIEALLLRILICMYSFKIFNVGMCKHPTFHTGTYFEYCFELQTFHLFLYQNLETCTNVTSWVHFLLFYL